MKSLLVFILIIAWVHANAGGPYHITMVSLVTVDAFATQYDNTLLGTLRQYRMRVLDNSFGNADGAVINVHLGANPSLDVVGYDIITDGRVQFGSCDGNFLYGVDKGYTANGLGQVDFCVWNQGGPSFTRNAVGSLFGVFADSPAGLDPTDPSWYLILTEVPCFTYNGGVNHYVMGIPFDGTQTFTLSSYPAATGYEWSTVISCLSSVTITSRISPADGQCVFANGLSTLSESVPGGTDHDVEIKCIPQRAGHAKYYGVTLDAGPVSTDQLSGLSYEFSNLTYNGYIVTYPEGSDVNTPINIKYDDLTPQSLAFSVIDANGNVPDALFEFTLNPSNAPLTFLGGSSSYAGSMDGSGNGILPFTQSFPTGIRPTETAEVRSDQGYYNLLGKMYTLQFLPSWSISYLDGNSQTPSWDLTPQVHTISFQATPNYGQSSAATVTLRLDKTGESVYFNTARTSSSIVITLDGSGIGTFDLLVFRPKNTYISGTYLITADFPDTTGVSISTITAKGASVPCSTQSCQLEYNDATKPVITFQHNTPQDVVVRILDVNGNNSPDVSIFRMFMLVGGGSAYFVTAGGGSDGTSDTRARNNGIATFTFHPGSSTTPHNTFIIGGENSVFGYGDDGVSENPLFFCVVEQNSTTQYQIVPFNANYGFTPGTVDMGTDGRTVTLEFRITADGQFVSLPQVFVYLDQTSPTLMFVGNGSYVGTSDFTQGQNVRSIYPDVCGIYKLPIKSIISANGGFLVPGTRIYMSSANNNELIYNVTVTSGSTQLPTPNRISHTAPGTAATTSTELGNNITLTGVLFGADNNPIPFYCYTVALTPSTHALFSGQSYSTQFYTASDGTYSIPVSVFDEAMYTSQFAMVVTGNVVRNPSSPTTIFEVINVPQRSIATSSSTPTILTTETTTSLNFQVLSPTIPVTGHLYTLIISPSTSKLRFSDGSTTKDFTTNGAGVITVNLLINMISSDAGSVYTIASSDVTLPTPIFTMTVAVPTFTCTYNTTTDTNLVGYDYHDSTIDQSTVSDNQTCCTRIYFSSGVDPRSACDQKSWCQGYSVVGSGDATLKSGIAMGSAVGSTTYIKISCTTIGATTTALPTTTSIPTSTVAPTTTAVPTSTATPTPAPTTSTASPSTTGAVTSTVTPTAAPPTTTAQPTTFTPTTLAPSTAAPSTTTTSPVTTAMPTPTSTPTGTPTPVTSQATSNLPFLMLAVPTFMLIIASIHILKL